MVAYTKPQQGTMEERRKRRLRRGGEGDKIKFIERRFGCKIQESEKKARRSINCMFLG